MIAPIRMVRRAQPSRAMQWIAPLAAVVLTLLVSLAIFAALGIAPLRAVRALFIDPLSDLNGWSELALKASPLCLIALGLAIGFRGNIWNIGAEGQMYLGALCATGLAIHFQSRWGGALLPTMIVAGALGGMLWASIVAFLRARFAANEILVSLMLTYVADLLVKHLVYGPWRDPAANNFPVTVAFEDHALFPMLFEGMRLNASIFITLVAIPAAWVFMTRSFAGFQLRVTGFAPLAARYAGYGSRKAIWIALLVSGAAAGLAGAAEAAGPLGQMNDRWTPGYGFTAIIVAFLGRLHPVGIVLAALLMALLYIGGEAAQVALQLSPAVSRVFQGVLLMSLLGFEVLIWYRFVWSTR